jgi:hypothetical protein
MAHGNGDRQNQLLFREVNKRIREVTEGWGSEGPVQFHCECGREDCTATLELTPAQFDDLASGDDRFLVARGHNRRKVRNPWSSRSGDAIALRAEAPSQGAGG